MLFKLLDLNIYSEPL